MSKVLCTFSGPFGDILWSMPTVRAISQMLGEKVDFACMPYYKSLLPLIQIQPYVDKAFSIESWVREHSNHGDQPWNPPANTVKQYDRCFHLTYQGHPGLTAKRLPLIDFTADQQGLKLKDPLPFLSTPDYEANHKDKRIAYAFNDQYSDVKARFRSAIKSCGDEFVFTDVRELDWVAAATVIKHSLAFVGCRSSNNVIAHGVGQKNIFIYEPHPSRNASGHLGDIFGCPYGREVSAPWLAPPEICGQVCLSWLRQWKSEKETEKYATATA